VLAMFEWIKGGFGPAIRIALVLACVSQSIALPAETVAVRYREGVGHGFLVLRTPDGKPLADGDSTQVVRGDLVTSKMSFKFADGSVYEETTIFSQRGTFQLLKDHVVEKGPQFKPPIETSIDATTGEVTVRYTDDHGKEKVLTEKLALPPDVANGMLFTLLKDVEPRVPQTTVSYVAVTPKPRLVHLNIIPQNQVPFSIGNHTHKATRYLITVKIGGLAGLIAPLVGKKSPNMQAWVLAEGAPAFVRYDRSIMMVPPGGWNLLFLPHGPAVRLIHSNSLQTFNVILSFKPPYDGCSDQCGEVMSHHVRPTPSRM
jgi:hypothetical protein